MNKTLGLLLVVYSLLLAGISYFIYYLGPAVGRPTLITGMVGGALCLIWGLLSLAGRGRKALTILTLIPVSFAFLPQTVTAWSEQGREVQGRWVTAALTTVLLVLSVAMLIRIAWSGVVFDTPPAATVTRAKSDGPQADHPR